MPRAFRIAADGSMTREHRLLHRRRTDQHRPAGGHLDHQPQGGLERRHPDHVGGHRLPDPRHQRQGQGFCERQPQRGRPCRIGDSRRRRPPGGHDVRETLRGVAGHVVRQHDAAAEEHDRDARGVQQGSAEWAWPVGGAVHHLQPRPHRAANRADPQPEMVGNPCAARQHHLSRARRRRADPRPAEQHHRRHRAAHPRRAAPSREAPTGSRFGVRPETVGITSHSTVHQDPSWPTRRCGWRSPRPSTARRSPTSPSGGSRTIRFP